MNWIVVVGYSDDSRATASLLPFAGYVGRRPNDAEEEKINCVVHPQSRLKELETFLAHRLMTGCRPAS